MKRSRFLLIAYCLVVPSGWMAATPASADLTLVGGGLQLVEEGPVVADSGDPVPVNLATGATAFSSSDLGPELGISFHVAANLNDGLYGSSYTWIGGDVNPFTPDAFAGIDFGALVPNVQSIALSRNNALSVPFTDRHMGLYRLQYTQVPNPSHPRLSLGTTGNPATGWAEIGTLDYGPTSGEGTNYDKTWRRHRFNFDPVHATAVRLIVPGTGLSNGTAIDEIEVFDVAGDYVPPPPPPPPFEIVSAPGFGIAWDGNNGLYYDDNGPPWGALVPENEALAANGAVAFSSSDMGPELGISFHIAGNAIDGFYGNSNSWIGGSTNPFAPVQFIGVRLPSAVEVGSIAWGRDNGNNATDACGGQCSDRWAGLYTLQFTRVRIPNSNTPDTGDASTGWETLGTVEYMTTAPEFLPYLRTEFDVTDFEGGVRATGVRLLVPATGIGGGTAIDELEVYPVPEPAGGVATLVGCLMLLGWRRASLG